MMEYAPDGMLINHLKTEEDFVSSILSDLLNAVHYIHRKQVVHRDIKP